MPYRSHSALNQFNVGRSASAGARRVCKVSCDVDRRHLVQIGITALFGKSRTDWAHRSALHRGDVKASHLEQQHEGERDLGEERKQGGLDQHAMIDNMSND
jgi:hypothetical protein